jgi:CheY-specific phosphatase CheX
MNELNDLDLQGVVTGVTCNVFETMLSMDVAVSPEAEAPQFGGCRIVGAVSFAGKVMGTISIHVGLDFGRAIAAAMLGMEADEIEDDSEVHDVIGELSNMIAGEIKSRLCDAGLTCELSIPITTSGSNFKIASLGWTRFERYRLKSGGQVAWIEVSVKTGAEARRGGQ